MEGSDLVEQDTAKAKAMGMHLLKRDLAIVDGEKIRHNSDKIAASIVELICEDLRFKDMQNNPEYMILNNRLKFKKKKINTEKKSSKIKPIDYDKKSKNFENGNLDKKSKFFDKYQDRIKSIKESEEKAKKKKMRKSAERAKASKPGKHDIAKHDATKKAK